MKASLALAMTLACLGAAAGEPDGAGMFASHCAACHGAVGEGDGPAAATMTIAVPNLRTLAMRNGGVFPEDAVAAYIDGRTPRAAHGDRQMPVWGEVFTISERGEEDVIAARIKVLVWFIAELQYR